MEALVIIIVEFLAVLLWPVIAVIGAFLAAIAELLFEIIRAVLGRKSARRTARTQPNPAAPPAPSAEDLKASAKARTRMRRRLVGFVGVPIALALVPVIVANLFFFDPIARWTTDRIAARTGYDISYSAIDGDLFSGKLAVDDLRVTKPLGAGPGVDFAVGTAQIDVNSWTILGRNTQLETLLIKDVSGRVQMHKPAGSVQAGDAKSKPKTKRSFGVANLQFRNVDVEINPFERPPVRLEITGATSPLFRSHSAAFDLFFRSNLTAKLDGAPLSVQTKALSDRSRSTMWRLDEAPILAIRNLVGRAPATWFEDGTISVAVDDFWDLEDLTIDMDWNLTLRNSKIVAPAGANLREKALAKALDLAAKRRPNGIELGFTLVLDDKTFSASGSRDLSALWNAMLPSIRANLDFKDTSANPEPDPVETSDTKPTIGERAKSVAGRVGGLFKRDETD